MNAVIDEDQLRALDVKRLARGGDAQRAIVSLLVGDPKLGRDWAEAAARLALWAARDDQLGVADFLLGKNFYNGGRWTTAAEHLDRALARELVAPRIEREAWRMRLIVGCALGDLPAAHRAYERWRRQPDLNPAQILGVDRYAARCGVLSPAAD
jgi:hypothetical protein